MKTPRAIGLLSVVPGLGLALLGEARKGLAAFVFVLLLCVSAFAPWELVSVTALTLALTAWITQGYYAVVVAQRLARERAGLALPTQQVPESPAPPGVSVGERHLHAARRAVLKLLRPGERLHVALQGATGAPSGVEILSDLGSLALGGPALGSGVGIRQLYLGITDQHLVLVETDAFGQPSDLRRVPVSQVASVETREGALSDELVFDIGDANPLRVAVGRPMRQGTRQVVEILASRARVAGT